VKRGRLWFDRLWFDRLLIIYFNKKNKVSNSTYTGINLDPEKCNPCVYRAQTANLSKIRKPLPTPTTLERYLTPTRGKLRLVRISK